MKRLKSEKGVITMVTLITILFLLSFLISSYILTANKVKTQKEMIAETKKLYEPTSTMEEVFNTYVSDDNLIPIYTVEQLLSIGTGNSININGVYYNSVNDENTTYVLMNDLEFNSNDLGLETDWIPVDKNEDFVGTFNWNGFTIKVTTLDDNIVLYGRNAISKWKLNEQGKIEGVTENGKVVTTLMVGDKVNYDEKTGTPIAYTTDTTKGIGGSFDSATNSLVESTYTIEETGDLEWRVLGVNSIGQIELISTTPTNKTITLYGKEGYKNAITEKGIKGTLDTLCNNIYGQGMGAVSARSLTVEDINELVDYNPVNVEGSKYGTEYTYKYDATSNMVKGILSENSSANISEWSSSWSTIFYSPNWTIDSSNIGPKKLQYTYYIYNISAQFEETDNIKLTSDIITKGEGGTNYISQFVASQSIICAASSADYYVRYIDINGNLNDFHLCGYDSKEYSQVSHVRPVVTLSADIQISDSNNDSVFEIN